MAHIDLLLYQSCEGNDDALISSLILEVVIAKVPASVMMWTSL